MKILIIENEPAAAAMLKEDLLGMDDRIGNVSIVPGIAESVDYLQKCPDIDLIILNTGLSEGLCSPAFKKIALRIPIIFTMPAQEPVIQLATNGHHPYRLKPPPANGLGAVLKQFGHIENHFALKNLHNNLLEQLDQRRQDRIVIKKGTDFQIISIADISYFFVEQKIVFCVDRNNRKHITEWTNLGDACSELDPQLFFRANRKYIINHSFVKSFRHIEYGKTSVDMTVSPNEEIIISQENSIYFRSWIRCKKA